jgi:arylsulfatase A-like enzyme
MFGVRGLYHEGWMLSAVPTRAPWHLLGKTPEDPANAFQWERYDVSKDWTQNNNVADANPAKLKEMQERLCGGNWPSIRSCRGIRRSRRGWSPRGPT